MSKISFKFKLKPKAPTFIEVCAGCGGMSTGLMEAGFKPLLLNDNDPICCKTLEANHPGIHIVCESMSKLSLTAYAPDLLVGGMPCQSFSQAGKREGLKDDRGQLILEFKRLIDECKPKAFLIENVKGLVTHEKGATLKHIIAYLQTGNKYTIKYEVLNAVDYSVPQKRERLIIVGIRSDITKKYDYPVIHPQKLVLSDVLSNVPTSDGYSYPQSKKIVLDLVPPGGCWVDLPNDIQISYMGASYDSGGGKRGIARRMAMTEACLTLTTSPMQKQTERCHPTETRPFTIREYARIQTFPDTFIFCGSMAKQYKQIGNAVPVQLAKAIGQSIITCLS